MNVNDITLRRIGVIDNGIDGSDEYLLAARPDFEDFDLAELNDHLEELYFYDHGQSFCRGISVMIKPYKPWEAVVTVHHRLDV